MSGTRYLVIGGAGFIGSHIVDALLAVGASVRVLDNFSSGRAANLAHIASEVEVCRGDVRDLRTVTAALDGIEVIFHQAAVASVQASIADPVTTLAINVLGTQNVLAAARACGVRRVVLASSAAVYGDAAALPATEEAMPAPISPYAVHKLTTEYLGRLSYPLYGVEAVALRYFNVYGPRQDPNSDYSGVISRFAAVVAAGGRPTIFGDGKQTRDFIYVGDVARANLLAASAQDAVGRAINIASGTRISLNDILSVMSGLLGREIVAEYRAARAGDILHSGADTHVAARVLGFQPDVSFADGMRATLASLGVLEKG